MDYIEAHLGSRLSLRKVAAASGLSIGALARLFPHHTGSSPYAYIIRKRVERAKRLLQATDMPIAQVAVETGFADQAHMTKAFSRHLGQTPRSLRQALGA
jgi:AraC family transcriptional regulator